ncbi:RNA 2'-phosphotransferase [Rhizobium sp. MHM7A]|uniref:RNA 2'-phosphotransferase n=1 Tax=Rhizobium sp. MHM7A TaxID=2583233 RepID=UPI001106C2AA|nr:RNA 2'-phosphotransferase [Rhizobium sp. MHM7A]TLX15899.1 RNA 2'-phosphotransferase [Rhizobium sp. MHM7A]
MSKDLSRLLSRVLRHEPEFIGIDLDPAGWVRIDKLLSQVKKSGFTADRELLDAVVANNDKKRFTISEDGQRIRAAQGHSVEVDLGLLPSVPPALLFHGTATANLDSIFEKGLIPGSRRHVHLSKDETTALKVGQRHGKALVLKVNAGRAHADGIAFFVADNGVWLTEALPATYLSF